MPTLFRLLVSLLFLGVLVAAGLFAAIVFVNPGHKEITVTIPARELHATSILPERAPKSSPALNLLPPNPDLEAQGGAK